MSVEIANNTPGQLYIHDDGDLYFLHHYISGPSACVQNVETGSQTGGGIGCLNLEPFRKIQDVSNDVLIEVIKKLKGNLETSKRDRMERGEKILALQEKYLAVREELFELKHGEKL